MVEHQDRLVTLETKSLHLKISPAVGASIYGLQYNLDGKFVPVMRPTPPEALKEARPGAFSSFNMIPYSNRIEKGVLLHRGQSYQLAINNPEGHSIHGEVRTRPWKVLSHTKDSVKLGFESRDYQGISWPFWFSAQIEYKLTNNSLVVNMFLQNQGDQEMPGGIGMHPYFNRHLVSEDEQVLLQIPIIGIYPGETPIPTGPWQIPEKQYEFSKRRHLSTDYIDKCYRVHPQPVTIDWVNSRVRLTMSTDKIYQHLVLYCPKNNPNYFAVEPVTNCNNGFNMANQGIEDTGTVYLKSNQVLQGSITFTLDRLP